MKRKEPRKLEKIVPRFVRMGSERERNWWRYINFEVSKRTHFLTILCTGNNIPLAPLQHDGQGKMHSFIMPVVQKQSMNMNCR